MNEPTYGLIGRGRVATHMAHYLKLEGQRLLRWRRGESESPEEALAEADVILPAINDDALGAFVADHPFLQKKTTAHFSGSRVIEGITGLHPLMTFGPSLYDITTYRSIPFIGEADGLPFHDVFPHLSNPSYTLDADQKPLYHALCVLSGNFSTLLWDKAFSDFEGRLGLPREILLPYLRQVSANTAVSGAEALTGALARKDQETTRIDLQALAGDPFEAVFRSMTDAFNNREFQQ